MFLGGKSIFRFRWDFVFGRVGGGRRYVMYSPNFSPVQVSPRCGLSPSVCRNQASSNIPSLCVVCSLLSQNAFRFCYFCEQRGGSAGRCRRDARDIEARQCCQVKTSRMCVAVFEMRLLRCASIFCVGSSRMLFLRSQLSRRLSSICF